MNKPFVFIETPRAGKHNHRFIVPDDYTSGDGLLSQWADFARQKTESNDYIGAKREAKQQSSGRTGWEQIILAGVNTKLLSKEQMEAIRTFLTERLPDVERLVTQTINWEQATKIIIPRPELNQWLQKLEQRLGVPIPAMPQEIKSQIKTKSASKRRWFMELVIGSVIISGFFIWIAMNNLEKNDPSSQIIENLTNIKAERLITAIGGDKAERLITAIGGDDEDKVKSELDTSFGLYNPNTWKNSQAGKIPATGDWQLAWFISSLNNEGRDFATGLWGPQQLIIQDDKGALQPLVQCRIAIRNLMGIEKEVYTPFFKPEDFGEATNSFTALSDKIYEWTDKFHPDALKGKSCDTKPKSSEILTVWIKKCVKTIDDKVADGVKNVVDSVKDKKQLSGIKTVGDVCHEEAIFLRAASNKVP